MSLVQRLQREAKANPAKAAALGVGLLVAVYFWAPLMAGMFASDAPPAPPVPSVAAAAAPLAQAPGTPSAAPATAGMQHDWRSPAKQLEEHPLMRSAAKPPLERDPFASISPEPAEAETPQVLTSEPANQPLTPAEAGLILSSTLVSARNRMAEINGRRYRVGERIKAIRDGFTAGFKVVDVQPRLVILERDGQRYELKIPRPLLDSANTDQEPEDGEAEGGAAPRSAEPVRQQSPGDHKGN